MDNIGIIKQFDRLGRLVIPKDLRERYLVGDKVEIIATVDGILIRDPEYVLMRKSDTIQTTQLDITTHI